MPGTSGGLAVFYKTSGPNGSRSGLMATSDKDVSPVLLRYVDRATVRVREGNGRDGARAGRRAS